MFAVLKNYGYGDEAYYGFERREDAEKEFELYRYNEFYSSIKLVRLIDNLVYFDDEEDNSGIDRSENVVNFNSSIAEVIDIVRH